MSQETIATDKDANVATAREMIINGYPADRVAVWLWAQCPDHFQTPEDAAAAIGHPPA